MGMKMTLVLALIGFLMLTKSLEVESVRINKPFKRNHPKTDLQTGKMSPHRPQSPKEKAHNGEPDPGVAPEPEPEGSIYTSELVEGPTPDYGMFAVDPSSPDNYGSNLIGIVADPPGFGPPDAPGSLVDEDAPPPPEYYPPRAPDGEGADENGMVAARSIRVAITKS